MAGVAVAVCDLWKKYATLEAVRGVSFDVEVGHIFGLLGPNGAGKTTIIECILGLRDYDRGSIRVHGLDLRTHATEVKLRTGAQLQAAMLQDKITPRMAVHLFGSFYSGSAGADDLLERFDLSQKADSPFGSLSGGQRQRLFLALALVNRPSLLVLDEPTAGLDPAARRTLQDLIVELRSEGKTVLLSTHDLQEAEQICDQVAIVHLGRLVSVGSPAELIGRSEFPARITVRTSPPLGRASMQASPDVSKATETSGRWVLETRHSNRVLADIMQEISASGVELLEIQVQRPTLEDVFLEVTGRPWPGDESERTVA